MESKKISELEQYNGSASGFMVPGVADGETQKANLGAMVDQAAEAAGYLKPSGLKTINGESIAGSGDLNVAVMNPLKGTFLDTDTLPTTGQDGDYIFVVNTSVTPRTANVYAWNGTAFADTGKSVENFGLQFASGQAVSGVAVKDLDGDNDPNAAGVLSAEAGKGLNEKLYGAVDETETVNLFLGAAKNGGFLKTPSESQVWGSAGAYKHALCMFYGPKQRGYKKIKVTMPLYVSNQTNGGYLTFIKRADLPTADKSYAEMVSGGYLSAVHDSYSNTKFICNINSAEKVTTAFDIPDDAIGVCFTYRTSSSEPEDLRKPETVAVAGIRTGGSVAQAEDGISTLENDVYIGSTVMAKTGIASGYIMASSGLWHVNSNVNHGYVDVSGLRGKYIEVRNSDVAPSSVCFVTAMDTVTENAMPSYVAGECNVHSVAAGTTGASEVFKVPQDANYMYVYIGGSGSTYADPKVSVAVSVKDVIEDNTLPFVGEISSWDSQFNGFVNSKTGYITSGSYPVYCKRVSKGERFLVMTQCDAEASDTELTLVGFSQTEPAVGGYMQNLSYYFHTNTGVKTYAFDAEAPFDGWMAFRYRQPSPATTIAKIFSIGKAFVGRTFVECAVAARVESNSVVTKTYDVAEGLPLALIYRTVAGQTFNSVTWLDENNNTLGTSSDSGAQEGKEHLMDIVTVPTGAVKCELRFGIVRNSSHGTLEGMAALMEPLFDDGKVPSNDLKYFVSYINADNIPNLHNESSTYAGLSMWSAWEAKFPDNYRKAGLPMPLASFFHGSSGFGTSEQMGYEVSTQIHDEFLRAGIVVFDINGKGISFEDGDNSRHWGCPEAVAVAKRAYDVLTGRFNCKEGVVVSGISMGGNIFTSFAMTYPQICRACYMMAPSNTAIALRNPTHYANGGDSYVKAWNVAIGSSDTETLANAVTAIHGYHPLSEPLEVVNGAIVKPVATQITYSDITNRSRIYLAPFAVKTIIWHGTRDDSVPFESSEIMVAAARAANSNVKLRVCQSLPHNLMNTQWVVDEMMQCIKDELLV